MGEQQVEEALDLWEEIRSRRTRSREVRRTLLSPFPQGLHLRHQVREYLPFPIVILAQRLLSLLGFQRLGERADEGRALLIRVIPDEEVDQLLDLVVDD